MRISDWSSDVCSSDLQHLLHVARRDRLAGLPLGSKAAKRGLFGRIDALGGRLGAQCADRAIFAPKQRKWIIAVEVHRIAVRDLVDLVLRKILHPAPRSEEHTSELQSLMRISYAVFCLKKKK